MLDGLWTIDITDERGMHARGLVIFRDGAVLADGGTIEIGGSYEEQDDAILANLDVVLRGVDPNGAPAAEYVNLHVQGRVTGHTISASGINLAGDSGCVRLHLEHRSAIAGRAVPPPPGMEAAFIDGPGRHDRR